MVETNSVSEEVVCLRSVGLTSGCSVTENFRGGTVQGPDKRSRRRDSDELIQLDLKKHLQKGVCVLIRDFRCFVSVSVFMYMSVLSHQVFLSIGLGHCSCQE